MELTYFPELLANTAANPPVKDSHATFGFYPSSASVEWTDDGTHRVVGACLRQQYYKHAEVPESDPPQAHFYLMGHFGNAIHSSVVELTKRAGIWRGDEGRFFIPQDDDRERAPVSGRWDLFVRDPQGGRPIGVEIKTIHGYYAEKMCLGEGGKPKEEHILQSLLYLDYYGRFGVEMWVLMYISRGSGDIRQYHIRIGESGEAIVDGIGVSESYPHLTVQNMYSRWWSLMKAVEEKELPARDYSIQWSNAEITRRYRAKELNQKDTRAVKKRLEEGDTEGVLLNKGDWQCAYCNFKTICYGVQWSDDYTAPQVVRPFHDPILNDPTLAPAEAEPDMTGVI